MDHGTCECGFTIYGKGWSEEVIIRDEVDGDVEKTQGGVASFNGEGHGWMEGI